MISPRLPLTRSPRHLPLGPLATLLAGCALFANASAQSVERLVLETDRHFDGLDFAHDGHLYYSGSWRGTEVFRSLPGGELEVYASGFDGATDTVLDSKGNLFVSNYNADYISIVTPDRKVAKFVSTPQGPAGMAIDADDNIYVTIFGLPHGDGRSVLKITPAGEVSTYLDDPALHGSVGLAIDTQGALYVLAGRDARVFRSTGPGNLELFSCLPLAFGRGGGAHLDWAAGNLFAASGIGAAYRIDANGALHYLLREGTERTSLGPPVSPLLKGCNGLAVSSTGGELFLGCAGPDGARTIVRVDLDGIPPGMTVQDGWAALQAGQFEFAEAVFDQLASTEPVAPGVWLGLGNVHYRKRSFSEAADYFTRAADAPHLAINGHYNAACAAALGGRIDEGFTSLEAAIEAGYQDLANLISDADLKALHSDARWAALLEHLQEGS